MAVVDHPVKNRIWDANLAETLPDKTHAPLEEMPAGTFESSNVHSALYDFGERELFIRYLRDGIDAIYQYVDVPASEWQGLESAGSKGSYINANIAYDYRYAKVGREELRSTAENLPQSRIRRFCLTP
jgi:hypothetical protein